jgi:F0F1-type ATP synthase assembly protein I
MSNKRSIGTQYLYLIIKIGSGVLTAILSGFLIGLALDRTWALNGLGVLVGVILGVVIGFMWLYRAVMRISNHDIDIDH